MGPDLKDAYKAPSEPKAGSADEAAASWWMARETGHNFDPDGFQAWLTQDAENAAAWARVQAIWQGFGDHRAAPELAEARLQARHWARAEGQRQRAGLATRRGLIAAGLGVLGVAVAAPLLLKPKTSFAQSFATGVGEQRALSLPDGSRVTLDANSALSVRFDRKARHVAMTHGRAYFEVAHNADLPFRVVARQDVVTALGTAFSVELRNQKVSVTLMEGRVSVGRVGADGHIDTLAQLSPLQKIVLSGDAAPSVSSIDAAHDFAWRDGRIYFDDEPLASAAARMNDYSATRINVVGKATGIRVSGMFSAGQSEAFAEAVAAYYPVSLRRGDHSLTIGPRG